ncbi:MAG: nucleotide exchange factor GrpE [Bacteroidetes bacterium]|nr:nucleotide exchange factor GrpE [Bacteroidota bacterium]
MQNSLYNELESSITAQLETISALRNDVLQKELEKGDQLKAIALGIIDTLDSFERIEEGLAERGLDKTDDGAKVAKRYQSIQKKLLALLGKFGITRLEFPEGVIIVGFTKVKDTEPSPSRKNDEIISVVQQGYIRGKELIREAEVIIVKN